MDTWRSARVRHVSGSVSGSAAQERRVDQQFENADDDDDQAAEEPDLDCGDGVGGGRGGPGDGQ